MMTTSAFFDRLRGVADDLDNGLRSLTVKQNVLARRKAADSAAAAAAAAEAGTAAQKAEVRNMSLRYCLLYRYKG